LIHFYQQRVLDSHGPLLFLTDQGAAGSLGARLLISFGQLTCKPNQSSGDVDLLSLIGAMAGSAAVYHAMTSLGFASEIHLQGGRSSLQGDPKGAFRAHSGRGDWQG